MRCRRRCSRCLSSFVFSTTTPRAHVLLFGIVSLPAAPSKDSRRSSQRRRSCEPSAPKSAAGLPREIRDLLRPPPGSPFGPMPMSALLVFLLSLPWQNSLRPCAARASSAWSRVPTRRSGPLLSRPAQSASVALAIPGPGPRPALRFPVHCWSSCLVFETVEAAMKRRRAKAERK